jgi:uncharacterized protein with FMN-binding domain
MKKFILSLFVLASFGFYAISQNTSNSSSNNPIAPVAVSSNKNTVKNGIYNDGTYTGNSANAYYGNVQVQVTISNGRIADVKFLDYPQGARNSERINTQAIPILAQEAISAQSANVNGVSGASETSSAFIQSLTSALNQAKA